MPAPIVPISTLEGNRRQADRLRTWIRADFQPLLGHGKGSLELGELQRALVSDLSRTGAFLTEVGYLRVGTTIHLFVRLPDRPGNPLVCYAKVARRQTGETPGYGLRFLRLSTDDEVRLARYVQSLRDRDRRALPAPPTIELDVDDMEEVA